LDKAWVFQPQERVIDAVSGEDAAKAAGYNERDLLGQNCRCSPFPVTPGGKVPVKVNWAIVGTWNQVVPAAQIEQASVLTTENPSAAIAPYIGL